jgi:hypothetical protein
MHGIFGIAALFLGLGLILADEHVSRAFWRRAEEPEAGATSVRMLGAILFIAGGVAFLTWTP